MHTMRWLARQTLTFTVMQAAGWSIGFLVMPWTSFGGAG